MRVAEVTWCVQCEEVESEGRCHCGLQHLHKRRQRGRH